MKLGIFGILFMAFIIGCVSTQENSPGKSVENAMETEEAMAKINNVTDVMDKKKDAMMAFSFSGKRLAGKDSPLIDFNKADYDSALKTDKLVVLYFYANWCPVCKNEAPNGLEASFNEIEDDKVVGFRVNYRDDETSQDEVDLAREYGIGYQHTKVFIKGKERVLKSPEAWDKKRYLDEIQKYV